MTRLDDVRLGCSPHPAAVAAAVAVASTSVPIALVAWASWQAVEGNAPTLLRSQFSSWAWLTSGAAVLTCVAAAAFWRTRSQRVAAALGVLLAGLGVGVGLLVDIVGAGGSS